MTPTNKSFPLALVVVLAISGFSLCAVSCSDSDDPMEPDPTTPVWSYTTVNTYPHDSTNTGFTQGLAWADSSLYEGTGLDQNSGNHSILKRIRLETGEVQLQHDVVDTLFGEGIAIMNDEIVQLTWTTNFGFRYNKSDFSETGQFAYATEGWGITHDGTNYIMSDGSDTLYFRDPVTFDEIRRITVKENGTRVTKLNELEYINGRIYANLQAFRNIDPVKSNRIAVIDPSNGVVTAWLDLTNILSPNELNALCIECILNGIAYDPATDRIFVTGKKWPKLFEIEIVK